MNKLLNLFFLILALLCFMACGTNQNSDSAKETYYEIVYLNESGEKSKSEYYSKYINTAAGGTLIQINDSFWIPTTRVLSVTKK